MFHLQFRRKLERVEHRVFLGFFHEARDAMVLVRLHDAERFRLRAPDRNRRHGDACVRLDVLRDDGAKIHAIQLIAAQDDEVIEIVIQKVNQIFPHRVRRAFIPRRVVQRLLRRENFHEAARELVELIRPRNMAVQRRGIELRQNINAPVAGIDAVRDRDVHETIFARERHGGFGAILRERKQAGALTTAHDDTENFAGIVSLASGA